MSSKHKFNIGDYVYCPESRMKCRIENINEIDGFYITDNYIPVPFVADILWTHFIHNRRLYICTNRIYYFNTYHGTETLPEGSVVRYYSTENIIVDPNGSTIDISKEVLFKNFLPWSPIHDVKPGDIVVSANRVLSGVPVKYDISIVGKISDEKITIFSEITWNRATGALEKGKIIWNDNSFFEIAPPSNAQYSEFMERLRTSGYEYRDSKCIFKYGKAMDDLLKEFYERLSAVETEGLSKFIIKHKERLEKEIIRIRKAIN